MLIPCRECGREISDQAESCPHCGLPDPGMPRGEEGQWEEPTGASGPRLAATVLSVSAILSGVVAFFMIGMVVLGGGDEGGLIGGRSGDSARLLTAIAWSFLAGLSLVLRGLLLKESRSHE